MNGIGKTNQGMLRNNNEDSIFVCNEPLGSLPNLYIVSDGMGGHRAGEVASSKAIEFFCEYVKNNSCLEADILDFIIAAVGYANKRVFQMSIGDEDLVGMGATFSACVVKDDRIYAAHIGDSRIYCVTQNKIRQISTDHTYVNEMVRAGEITEQEAKTHPNRNIITRALGTDDIVEVDGIISRVEDHDWIIICSDGLTNMISDEQILDVVSNNAEISQKTEKLIDFANKNGGDDNISVVLIHIER